MKQEEDRPRIGSQQEKMYDVGICEENGKRISENSSKSNEKKLFGWYIRFCVRNLFQVFDTFTVVLTLLYEPISGAPDSTNFICEGIAST